MVLRVETPVALAKPWLPKLDMLISSEMSAYGADEEAEYAWLIPDRLKNPLPIKKSAQKFPKTLGYSISPHSIGKLLHFG